MINKRIEDMLLLALSVTQVFANLESEKDVDLRLYEEAGVLHLENEPATICMNFQGWKGRVTVDAHYLEAPNSHRIARTVRNEYSLSDQESIKAFIIQTFEL